MDDQGRSVLLSDDEITCTTTGPVRLLGLEAGNPVDMGDYTDNRQRVYQGKMMAYFQATGHEGSAIVFFESPWLKSTEVNLTVK